MSGERGWRMFGQKTMLLERAALNGIDIGPYAGYPPEMIKKILEALECGRSKRRLDQLAQSSKGLASYLEPGSAKDDIKAFVEGLLADAVLPKQNPDLRESFRKWDMILPEDSCFGWSTDSIPLTKDRLQRYADENDPSFGKNTQLFFLADTALQEHNQTDSIKCLQSAISGMPHRFDTDGENGMVPHYGIREAECLACYIVLSGSPAENMLPVCGEAAAAIGLDNAGIYKCMLEAASVAVMLSEGIWKGLSYYDAHRSCIRYRIHETGFFKKRMIAEEIFEKGTLFQDLSSAMKGFGDPVEELLRSGAGHNGLVLWHSIMEYTGDKKLEKGIFADREKQQYTRELYHFWKRRGSI